MSASDNTSTLASIDPRGAARLPLTLRGELLTSDGTLTCVVEDISATGARVRTSADLAPGEAGILRCDELDILGEVQWRNGHALGMAFTELEECHDDEVDDGFDDAHRRANNRRFLRLIESQT